MTAPGWYPDPSGDGTQRYWDGNAWGPSAPPSAAPPTTPPTTPAGVQVPVLPPLPPKKNGRLKPLLIIVGLLFAMYIFKPLFAGDKTESSSSPTSSSSSRSSNSPASGSVGNSAAKEDAYIALLQKWANRDGYTVGDRATLIAAGNEACSRMAGGEDGITASAAVMDSYGLPGKQAGAVGVAAAEVLCPQNDPLSRLQPSSTVKPTTTAITGLQSPLMGITMPAGSSDGTSIVNDFNKDGEPNRMENWEVSMSYDATLDAMKEILQPYGGPFDGIPWEEGNSKGTAADQDRYADWWWGRDGWPLILVRVQQFGDNTTTTVHFERRD